MRLLKKHKQAIQGMSLLIMMSTPFGMYQAARNGWSFVLYSVLALMGLAMLAIVASD